MKKTARFGGEESPNFKDIEICLKRKRPEHCLPSISMNKVMGAMNPGRSFRDRVYPWGCNQVKVSGIVMYSRVSFKWKLPDVFAHESVF